MVDAYAGGNTHSGSAFACPVGHTADGGLLVLEYAYCTVLGFVSGGKCCSAGGRVGNAVGGTLGIHQCGEGEAGEAQFLDADAAFQRAQIGLGRIDLVNAHTVTDKIEHILGLSFGHCCQSKYEKA